MMKVQWSTIHRVVDIDIFLLDVATGLSMKFSTATGLSMKFSAPARTIHYDCCAMTCSNKLGFNACADIPRSGASCRVPSTKLQVWI